MELVDWASSKPPAMRGIDPAEDEEAGAKPAIKAKLLIVEDDYLVAGEIEHALVEAGHDVIGIADSAEEAVEIAREQTPTIIIMDIRLNGIRDGIDAALEIFAESGIRCIFATAHADALTLERASPAEPLGWLQKPFPVRDLVALVRLVLQSPL